jgi:hypothetical protein
LVDRDVAHPEQLGDHSLADIAQRVEQHRQRLHGRRLAARRRRREITPASLAAVALVTGRHAVPDERCATAMLAAKLSHGRILARGHERDISAISLKLSVSEIVTIAQAALFASADKDKRT